MAFQNRNLSVIAYANGFTLWHYKTNEEKIGDIKASAEYFKPVADLMASGDIIMLNCVDGSAILCVKSVVDKTVILDNLQ